MPVRPKQLKRPSLSPDVAEREVITRFRPDIHHAHCLDVDQTPRNRLSNHGFLVAHAAGVTGRTYLKPGFHHASVRDIRFQAAGITALSTRDTKGILSKGSNPLSHFRANTGLDTEGLRRFPFKSQSVSEVCKEESCNHCSVPKATSQQSTERTIFGQGNTQVRFKATPIRRIP